MCTNNEPQTFAELEDVIMNQPTDEFEPGTDIMRWVEQAYALGRNAGIFEAQRAELGLEEHPVDWQDRAEAEMQSHPYDGNPSPVHMAVVRNSRVGILCGVGNLSDLMIPRREGVTCGLCLQDLENAESYGVEVRYRATPREGNVMDNFDLEEVENYLLPMGTIDEAALHKMVPGDSFVTCDGWVLVECYQAN